jgi:hypothetical protein
MTKQQSENVEELKNTFITWQWGVTLVAGAIVVIATCMYVYGSSEAKQDAKLVDLETRINKVEMIQHDLDTVKQLLRAKR